MEILLLTMLEFYGVIEKQSLEEICKSYGNQLERPGMVLGEIIDKLACWGFCYQFSGKENQEYAASFGEEIGLRILEIRKSFPVKRYFIPEWEGQKNLEEKVWEEANKVQVRSF